MIGLVRKRHVLTHPVVTVQSFGWRAFFRCLVAGRNQTFLSLVMEARPSERRSSPAGAVVGRCVELEHRAGRLYESLAGRFSRTASIHAFFTKLARQEEEHAELLRLSLEASRRAGWDADRIRSLSQSVSRLESSMGDAEARGERVRAPAEALGLVLDVESSEINRVFADILRASASAFLEVLDPFHTAAGEHIAYICRRVPELEPGWQEACRTLLDVYRRGS